jgi:uncharacterized protein YndB with AHSA1/START domain
MPTMSASDTYTVERSVIVRADAGRVYQHIVDFHRWPAWSPWEDVDPNLQRTYSGATEGVGSVYEWSGNRKAGAGRMEITHADRPSRVVIDLSFLRPFKSSSTITFSLAAEGDGTRITWTMTGARTLGLRLMGVFASMDKLVGGDFDKGLARLRRVTESPAA